MKPNKKSVHRYQHAPIGPDQITFKDGAWYVDRPRPDWFSPDTWRDIDPAPWRVTDPGQGALLEACKRGGTPLWVTLAHGFGISPAFTDQEPTQET